ncbi:uncharacterized protein LOC132169106 [Corylus avellana]|uniref:uncharacterized protein LOC132169106 n=1 Tax=Corylus avellana TaxID=13451 RepID=UPI00286BEBAF|nr:uncharacterized protein LOC132169106 [Corylus avellana]
MEKFIPKALAKEAETEWQLWEKSIEQQEDKAETAPNEPTPFLRWTAPVYNTYKANWDVSVKPVSRHFGVGIIVRDYMGQVCAASCLAFEGRPDPTVAEAMGALCAVEFCRDLGLKNIMSWRMEHVRRAANEAAHGLARAAEITGVDRIWMEEVPEVVHDIVVLEQFALIV